MINFPNYKACKELYPMAWILCTLLCFSYEKMASKYPWRQQYNGGTNLEITWI
ncbi:hypothetical protein Hanom_Chr02g00171301 [Helianthus anomalus]